MDNIDILLTKYCSGEATPEERQGVEAWAQASEANRAELVFYQNLWAESATARVKTYDAQAAWGKVARQTVERPSAKIVALGSAWRWTWLAAAAAVLAVAAGVQFFSGGLWGERWQEVTAERAPRQVSLPDGSVVWLNVGAKLRFPQKFGGGERAVLLEGEAFFEVAHDAAHPFIIRSGLAEATVLGTSFQFSAGAERAQLTVATGRVQFVGSSGEGAVLTVGEKAVYDGATQTLQKGMNTDPNYLAWKTGVFEFDGTDIRAAVTCLNTFYRTKPIVFSSQKAVPCALSARFEGAKIEAVLDVLAATCGLRWAEKAEQYEVMPE